MSQNTNSSQTQQQSNSNLKQLDISDFSDFQDINGLSVRELKIILSRNCVDYRDIIEKEVLRERVVQLWIEFNEKKVGPQANQNSRSAQYDSQICKICMESEIDSVLLECGHILACVECGNRLSECPICRQTITRCVKTFRG